MWECNSGEEIGVILRTLGRFCKSDLWCGKGERQRGGVYTGDNLVFHSSSCQSVLVLISSCMCTAISEHLQLNSEEMALTVK